MFKLLIIGVGGFFGAISRYLVSAWAARIFGTTLPYGTLLVNVIGCFLVGFFMAYTVERVIIHPYWRLLIVVGYAGALTTFSALSFESINLAEDGSLLLAGWNVLLNFLAGFTATWLAISLAKAL